VLNLTVFVVVPFDVPSPSIVLSMSKSLQQKSSQSKPLNGTSAQSSKQLGTRICHSCGGNGYITQVKTQTCSGCWGSGVGGFARAPTPCRRCGGAKIETVTVKVTCPHCRGSGTKS
jgi:RecJ-like exonuclease